MKQRETEWTRLENAAKFFPATCNEKDPKVFRLSCELNEPVDREILQKALNIAFDNFPLYKSVVRKGAFWYYLESSNMRPQVEIESNPVCYPLYIGHKTNLLFRVFYFNNRINFEVFHALTDGAGAFLFMQSLVHHYMLLKHNEFANIISTYDYPVMNMDDSFKKYFVGGNLFNRDRNYLDKVSAYHIRGTRVAENRLKLIEGSMSVKAVLELAHDYNTTLTIFIASLLIYSIYKDMPACKKNHPVMLSVPINLRKYFESETERNFFCTMSVGYDFSKNSDNLEAIIEGISESFERDLTEEHLHSQLNQLISLEQNPLIRIIPLPLKNMFIRIGDKLNDRQITSSISNLGQVSMPEEYASIIRQFSICTSTRRPKITMCSYNDRMVISFTSPFRETNIQRTFFMMLANKGMEIEITSNL